MIAPMSDTLTSIRRSFELFNEGRVDAIFEEIFDPEIDYSGDLSARRLADGRARRRSGDRSRAARRQRSHAGPGRLQPGSHRRPLLLRLGRTPRPTDLPCRKAAPRGASAALEDHLAGRR
jgi:hypothetical protein